MRKRSAICILSLMLAFSTVLFAACGNGDDNVSEEPLPNQLEFTFEDYTFGETASTPVVTKTPFDNAAITYTYEGRNDTEYAKSETAPSNAGEYTVTGTAAATDAYKSAEYSVNFTVEKASPDGAFSLLALRIETGRMHQIRRHLADAGFPIAADDKYGDFRRNREIRRVYGIRRLQLAATSLALPVFSGTEERIQRLTCPLPQHMQDAAAAVFPAGDRLPDG